VFDNPLGNTQYTAASVRHGKLLALLAPPTPPESALAISDPQERESVEAVLAGQILAAIPENPLVENLEESIAQSLFASHNANTQSRGRQATRSALKAILDEDRGAMAQAASPLQLTELGKAANVTGFSPSSSRQILEFLRSTEEEPDAERLCALLMREFGTLPEQPEANLRKTIQRKGSRFCVKPNDFELVAREFLLGKEMTEMFATLPYVTRSKRLPTVSMWLNGVVAESWDAEFDKFSDFVTKVFTQFLPWISRACGAMVHLVEHGWASNFNWRAFAEHLERRDEWDDIL
jgi:helicase